MRKQLFYRTTLPIAEHQNKTDTLLKKKYSLVGSFFILLIATGDLSLLAGSKIPAFLLMTLVLFITAFFLSFLIATMNVFLRDIQFILSFAINLAFFITPIFYPKELIPSHLQWLITYNPFYILIKPFQDIFTNYDVFLQDFALATALVTAVTLTTLIVWRRKKNDIYFNL